MMHEIDVEVMLDTHVIVSYIFSLLSMKIVTLMRMTLIILIQNG